MCRVALVALFSWPLAACVIVPTVRDVVELSPVRGVLRQDGKPAPGRTLSMNSVWNQAACDEPLQTVVTDARGAFAFAEVTRRSYWRAVILAPSSPTYSVTLCLGQEGASRSLFSNDVWGALPRELTLNCDLGDGGTGRQSCTVEDWVGFNGLVGHPEYLQTREPGEPAG